MIDIYKGNIYLKSGYSKYNLSSYHIFILSEESAFKQFDKIYK
jgi:hypothetical protein